MKTLTLTHNFTRVGWPPPSSEPGIGVRQRDSVDPLALLYDGASWCSSDEVDVLAAVRKIDARKEESAWKKRPEELPDLEFTDSIVSELPEFSNRFEDSSVFDFESSILPDFSNVD